MKTFVLSLFATAALASTHSSPLFARQISDCSSLGYKTCGTGCIPQSYTCCPRKDGGCPNTDNCDIGDNGETACCLKGETCTGDGGVLTNNLPGGTSTIIIGGTSTEKPNVPEPTTEATVEPTKVIPTPTTETTVVVPTTTVTPGTSPSTTPGTSPTTPGSPSSSGNGGSETTAGTQPVPTDGAAGLGGSMVGVVLAAGAVALML